MFRFVALCALSLVTASALADTPFAEFDGDELRLSNGEYDYMIACEREAAVGRGRLYKCRGGDASGELTVRFDEMRGAVHFKKADWWEGKRQALNCDVERKRPLHMVCDQPKFDSGRPGLISPFPSRVEGFDLPNASQYYESIYRSMNPQLESDYQQLGDLGFEQVIIFKTYTERTQRQLDAELESLAEQGIERIHHIPFPYHNLDDVFGEGNGYRGACRATVRALKILKDAAENDVKTIFHCTVGEDRTGYLSGVFRLVRRPRSSIKTTFVKQMCENGYGAGNPNKPYFVVNHIREDLTPLYVKMAKLVKQGKLRWDRLDNSACEHEPEVTERDLEGLECKTSTRYRP